MINFHAVMLDECGMEFGADISAATKDDAREALHDAYPENRGIVQLESPAETEAREKAVYFRQLDMYDFDTEEEW